jgi:hypothetical protein
VGECVEFSADWLKIGLITKTGGAHSAGCAAIIVGPRSQNDSKARKLLSEMSESHAYRLGPEPEPARVGRTLSHPHSRSLLTVQRYRVRREPERCKEIVDVIFGVGGMYLRCQRPGLLNTAG